MAPHDISRAMRCAPFALPCLLVHALPH